MALKALPTHLLIACLSLVAAVAPVSAGNMGQQCSAEMVRVVLNVGYAQDLPLAVCSGTSSPTGYTLSRAVLMSRMTWMRDLAVVECGFDVEQENWYCASQGEAGRNPGGAVRLSHPPPTTLNEWCSTLYPSFRWGTCP